MSHNSEGNQVGVRKGRRRIVVLLSAIPLILLFMLAVKVIPPVNGRVVDAVTGKSVRGVGLTLGSSSYEGWSVNTEVNHCATTGVFGWFFLLGGLSWRVLPTQFRSYWVTVNGGSQLSEMEERTAIDLVLYSPLANRRNAPLTDRRYFPLTVSFGSHGCDQAWSPTCMYKSVWWGISIPLIPVLEDVNECKKIASASLQENCRELNTYRAAFVHVDSYEEVRIGRELCNEVDHGAISKTCLERLKLYIANVGFDQKPFKLQVNEPVPDGMFPDSIAGVHATENRHCGPRLFFDGRVSCAGSYGTATKQFVTVYIEEWPETELSSKPPMFNHVGSSTNVTEERHLGGKITRYQGQWNSSEQRPDGKISYYQHQSNSFGWYSRNRLVEVAFYNPIPQQEQFLSYYLQKYPGSSE